MDETREGSKDDQAAIDAAAKDDAWLAGESKGRELALQGETRSEAVKTAGRDAGAAAAEKTGADSYVGERPGEQGALAGWASENPELMRAEQGQAREQMADTAWASASLENEHRLEQEFGPDWSKD